MVAQSVSILGSQARIVVFLQVIAIYFSPFPIEKICRISILEHSPSSLSVTFTHTKHTGTTLKIASKTPMTTGIAHHNCNTASYIV
jgi:hypothetical protein